MPVEAGKPVKGIARSQRFRQLAAGFIGGVLTWYASNDILAAVVPFVSGDRFLVIAGIVGAVLGASRYRRILWCSAAFTVLAIGTLGLTPLVDRIVPSWIREDTAVPTPAIVVLSAGADDSLDITANGQERLFHAYQLLAQGYAPRLILSRGFGWHGSWGPAVREQMSRLGLHFALEETRPVANTHDEAIEIGKIMRGRGWDRVTLVTDALHMRRAAAAFEKQGVRVICSPSSSFSYNVRRPGHMRARLDVFNQWLHEVIGYTVYKRRGWI